MDAASNAQDQFQRGRQLIEDGEGLRALEHLRTAHTLDPSCPRYRSAYGLALGLVERRFGKALELCRSAVREEFFNPDLVHDLARVHLAFGFKAEGIRHLREALKLDPDHAPSLRLLHRMGLRRAPVLRFLRRRHVLNRWLGQLRRRLERGGLPEPGNAGAPAVDFGGGNDYSNPRSPTT